MITKNVTYTIGRPPLHKNFQLPTRERLLSLKAGDSVKLIFVPDSDDAMSERMWVTLTTVKSPDEWQGTLDNNPAVPEGLGIDYGDTVRFHPLDCIDALTIATA